MRTCPHCKKNYPDEYGFCLDDGTPLSKPIEGEKTELIKGPYFHGGTTEHIEAKPVSDETVELGAHRHEPAPTVASPLQTLKAYAPHSAPKSDDRPQRRTPTVLWVAIAVLSTIVIAGVIYIFGLRPQNANTDKPLANAEPTATPLIMASVTPLPDAPQIAFPPDKTAQPIITATGKTEAETVEEPVKAQYKRGSISKWDVKEGDMVDPCRRPFLASSKNVVDIQQAEGPPVETPLKGGQLTWADPAIVLSLDVKEDETYYFGQRLALVGNIKHIWIGVKVDRTDAMRIAPGSAAFFTESQSNRLYDGTVDTVDKATGDIRIKLRDEEVFERARPNCLTIFPNRSGEVRFAVSNITGGK
ncbi:MAG TPA: hypothetical protein VGJ02_10360 [Pyrinomonadaceae bacterium]